MSLETHQLTVTIGEVQVCHELNMTLSPGQCLGVMGRNGVGKTTLLHTLAGLRAPASGEVVLDGNALGELSRRQVARHVGLLLQHHEDPFPSSVLETALIGRHPHLTGWQWETAEDLEIARHALAVVGLVDLEARPVATLSGGERRRLAIATLLTQDPPILLLDEPTNDLDLHYQIAILDHIVEGVRKNGKAVIAIMHDPNLAARYCDSLLFLYGDGEACLGASAELLGEATLSRLYRHPVEVIEGTNGRAYVPARTGIML